MSTSVYISGLPGIGKTSATEHMVESSPQKYVRMSFGEALREIASPDATVGSFRRDASFTVDRGIVERATAVLARRIDAELTRVVLVDSHAVTPSPEGLRATPDTAKRLEAFHYSLIAHLSAAGVEERILESSGAEGRTPMTTSEVVAAEVIQLSIVARYASLCDCPLYVVSATGSARQVGDRLDKAIRAGVGWAAEGK